jgi:hypothetical protein
VPAKIKENHLGENSFKVSKVYVYTEKLMNVKVKSVIHIIDD